MILPIGASKFEEALQIGAETYHHLKVNFEIMSLCLYLQIFCACILFIVSDTLHLYNSS